MTNRDVLRSRRRRRRRRRALKPEPSFDAWMAEVSRNYCGGKRATSKDLAKLMRQACNFIRADEKARAKKAVRSC